MVAAPSSLDPTPWAADSLAYAFSPLTEHTWSMTARELVWGDGGTFTMDAWDVTVDIDARRIPIAIATFKVPAAQAEAHPTAFNPVMATFITLNAGWKRTSGPDLHPVFVGGLVSMETSNGITTCRAVSMDGIMGAYSNYAVPYNATSVAQVVAAWSGYMVVNSITLTTEGALPTPTAGQLAAFRGMTTGNPGDGMTALNQMATALGCWIRGSTRYPTWLTLSARYDSGTALDLNSILDPETITITSSLDGFARSVTLTAVWNEGKLKKQSSNYYYGGGPVGFEQTGAAAVEIDYKPAGGVLSDTDPIGQAYASAYGSRTWTATATGRALWWLQPRQIVTIGTRTGQLETINLDVDAGTATYTIRPTSAY